ncbi:resolvase [Rathayibacter caricis DSM 15933]|uniref:Resolvase n=1 Tax=Rathayibacter caricis DSM 15933 TaxID=1328867 RepID=A0A2T4UTK3_9MICO|nr:recombinase family protein [Rathayibacter caricis]PTL72846.1 resolvase [Rathayibacter caricis DSM 15933]
MENNTPATETGYTFGYRRVSSVKQSYERQTSALLAAGVPEDRIFEDKITGARMDRPGLNNLLKVARRGDVILVSSLDRLGRTVLDTLKTMESLEEKGITVRSLKPGEDFSGVTGRLIRNLMASIAQWERENTAERAADARAARKAVGTLTGRSKTATAPDNVEKIRAMRAGGMTVPKIVEATGVSRASVFRALKD